MTRTAGAPIGCQRPSRFWGLGCPKIYHEAEDTLAIFIAGPFFSLMVVLTLPGLGWLMFITVFLGPLASPRISS
ncbi:hypothetical protein [Thiolapillus sp.]|uniref:hypothetical protein n=1 Tax=Thiolapillus sp. TaxID=2017437 RepID=UPI003AF9A291